MSKMKISDNYLVRYDGGQESTFYAVSTRQAWYTAYELTDGELLEGLYKIDENGSITECLMEED